MRAATAVSSFPAEGRLWATPGSNLSQLLDQPWRKDTEAQKIGQPGS